MLWFQPILAFIFPLQSLQCKLWNWPKHFKMIFLFEQNEKRDIYGSSLLRVKLGLFGVVLNGE